MLRDHLNYSEGYVIRWCVCAYCEVDVDSCRDTSGLTEYLKALYVTFFSQRTRLSWTVHSLKLDGRIRTC